MHLHIRLHNDLTYFDSNPLKAASAWRVFAHRGASSRCSLISAFAMKAFYLILWCWHQICWWISVQTSHGLQKKIGFVWSCEQAEENVVILITIPASNNFYFEILILLFAASKHMAVLKLQGLFCSRFDGNVSGLIPKTVATEQTKIIHLNNIVLNQFLCSLIPHNEHKALTINRKHPVRVYYYCVSVCGTTLRKQNSVEDALPT